MTPSKVSCNSVGNIPSAFRRLDIVACSSTMSMCKAGGRNHDESSISIFNKMIYQFVLTCATACILLRFAGLLTFLASASRHSQNFAFQRFIHDLWVYTFILCEFVAGELAMSCIRSNIYCLLLRNCKIAPNLTLHVPSRLAPSCSVLVSMSSSLLRVCGSNSSRASSIQKIVLSS